MDELNQNQKKAVLIRNTNILVSAGAGSGKTKVLTERVISFLLDDKHNWTFDNLLIMTFTNASAAEMKNRIRNKLITLLKDENISDSLKHKINIELQNIQNANISTIHSFCKYLIDNYYTEIGLDPDFRLANQNETEMLLDEAIDIAIENKLDDNKNYEIFFDEFYSLIKDKKNIKDFYDFLVAIPFYDEWLQKQKNKIEHYEDNGFVDIYLDEAKEELEKYIDEINDLRTTAKDNIEEDNFFNSAYNYFDCFIKIYDTLSKHDIYSCVKLCRDYDEYLHMSLKGNYKNLKKTCIDLIKILKNNFYLKYLTTLFVYNYEIKFGYVKIKKDLLLYIELIEEVIKQYKLLKSDSKIIDINDLEHFALDILYDKNNFTDDGHRKPSNIADELAKRFAQVFIDEYQDSNRLQEELLYALSSDRIGLEPNLFMVGDVKQSIYRFRLAEPDIFIQKYNHFEDATNKNLEEINNSNLKNCKIELNINYRSYKTVIDFTNKIFQQLFSKNEESEIIYGEQNKLRYQAEDLNNKNSNRFIEYENELSKKDLNTEIVLLQNDDTIENNGKFEDVDYYKYVAQKIVELKNKGYHNKDIVILAKSIKKLAIELPPVLKQYGIPSFAETHSGFISLIEIRNTIDFLKIIDNPLQDIPLVAVLHSYIYNFTNDELVLIKKYNEEYSNTYFYYALENFYKSNFNNKDKTLDDLVAKCKKFFETFYELRKKAKYYSISDLLYELYNTLDYYNLTCSIDDPLIKKANLDLLLQKAKEYENTSFTGLFSFIRYIENIQERKMDEGIASLFTEEDDIVRIKTIHGSKGLEFPVVFLLDYNGRLKIHSKPDFIYDYDNGIAITYKNRKNNIEFSNTIESDYIHKIQKKKETEEYKRVLYVALTRAKEKLVLVDTFKKNNTEKSEGIISNSTYFDMFNRCGIENEKKIIYKKNLSNIENKKSNIKENLDIKISKLNNLLLQYEQNKLLNYKYTLEAKTEPKTSVSNIKREAKVSAERFIGIEDNAQNIIQEDVVNNYDFSSADKGTIAHRFLELFDFSKIDIKNINDEKYLNDFICDEKQRIVEPLNDFFLEGRMEKHQVESINNHSIIALLKSDIGHQIVNAAKNGKLFREKSFMKLFDYDIVKGANDYKNVEKPKIIVQGVIDLFFEDENGITLLDYKTDKSDNKEYFIEKYQVQLNLYADVLKSWFNKPIKDKIIYSFYNNSIYSLI